MNSVDFLPTDTWLQIKGWIFHWLTTPSLVILPLLVLTALSWAISSWRKRLNQVSVLVLLIYLLFSSPVGAFLAVRGLTFPLPKDPGTKVDAIVVLNRGVELRDSRSELAAQLFRDGRSPRIWATGESDVEAIRKQLQAKISTESVAGIDCPRTTYEEAVFTAAILGSQAVERVILITDPPHMLRAFLTFKSFDWEVIPRLSSLPSDWSSAKVSWLSMQNYLGLFSYWLLGRFRQQPLEVLKHPAPETLRRLEAQNCKVR